MQRCVGLRRAICRHILRCLTATREREGGSLSGLSGSQDKMICNQLGPGNARCSGPVSELWGGISRRQISKHGRLIEESDTWVTWVTWVRVTYLVLEWNTDIQCTEWWDVWKLNFFNKCSEMPHPFCSPSLISYVWDSLTVVCPASSSSSSHKVTPWRRKLR